MNAIRYWRESLAAVLAVALVAVAFVVPYLGNELITPIINRTPQQVRDFADAAPLFGFREIHFGWGTPFAVLIAPARFEIRDRDPDYQKFRLEMVRALSARGIAVIDPIREFLSAGFQPTHFAHDGHWSALGHKIAARAAADWLRQQNIGN